MGDFARILLQAIDSARVWGTNNGRGDHASGLLLITRSRSGAHLTGG